MVAKIGRPPRSHGRSLGTGSAEGVSRCCCCCPFSSVAILSCTALRSTGFTQASRAYMLSSGTHFLVPLSFFVEPHQSRKSRPRFSRAKRPRLSTVITHVPSVGCHAAGCFFRGLPSGRMYRGLPSSGSSSPVKLERGAEALAAAGGAAPPPAGDCCGNDGGCFFSSGVEVHIGLIANVQVAYRPRVWEH